MFATIAWIIVGIGSIPFIVFAVGLILGAASCNRYDTP